MSVSVPLLPNWVRPVAILHLSQRLWDKIKEGGLDKTTFESLEPQPPFKLCESVYVNSLQLT